MFHLFPRKADCANNQGGEVEMRSEVDISGLPIFYVNKIITTKTDDGNVMVVCGVKHGTQFTPLHASISPASVAVEDGESYVETARLACGTAH